MELGTWNLNVNESLTPHSEKWLKTCPRGSVWWHRILLITAVQQNQETFSSWGDMIIIHISLWSCHQVFHWLSFDQNCHAPVCMCGSQERWHAVNYHFSCLLPCFFPGIKKIPADLSQGLHKHSKDIWEGCVLNYIVSVPGSTKFFWFSGYCCLGGSPTPLGSPMDLAGFFTAECSTLDFLCYHLICFLFGTWHWFWHDC